jgi:endonuclease/exonuclease/phosphatase family metal-dependent hydrolase
MNHFARYRRASLAFAIFVAALGCCREARAQVTVMSQNLYIGFDIEQYADDLLANPGDLLPLTTTAYANMLATDFPSRAAALALEVEQKQPHLIGLQEVALYRSAPFDGFGAPHATNVDVDFLQITLDALAARGLHYAAVSIVQNADAEFPRTAGIDADNNPILQDVRLTDRDVILARTDLPVAEFNVTNPQQANFANAAELFGVALPRGWTTVDVHASSGDFRLLSTHLDNDPVLQAAQGAELVGPGSPSDAPLPLVFIGDYNSPADTSTTATYANLLAAGFTDAWSTTHPGAPGYTWGQEADLLNPVSQASERIDLVLLGAGLSATAMDIVGEEPGDRTPSGLWPSDHAGVVATIVPEPSARILAILATASMVAFRSTKGRIFA